MGVSVMRHARPLMQMRIDREPYRPFRAIAAIAGMLGLFAHRFQLYWLPLLLIVFVPLIRRNARLLEGLPLIEERDGNLIFLRMNPAKSVSIPLNSIESWRLVRPAAQLKIFRRDGSEYKFPWEALSKEQQDYFLNYLESIAPGREVY